jgi:hypothetical protein
MLVLNLASRAEALPQATVDFKDPMPIEWLHIPNTGSSFGNTLLRWGCNFSLSNVVKPGGGFQRTVGAWEQCKERFVLRPKARINWPIGDHVPLPPQASPERLHSVVTMVRGPSRRGKKPLLRGNVCDQMRKQKAFGYQTSFITGIRTGKNEYIQRGRDPRPADAQRACMRIHYFTFVGITDLWQSSVCLFLKKLGGFDEASDQENVRPTKRRETLNLEKKGCPDTIDDALFQYALDRFLSEISWTVCANLIHHVDLGSSLANEKLDAFFNGTL